MLTWLIRRARNEEKSSRPPFIVQVVHFAIAAIGFSYEPSPARLLRRRRGRRLVHESRARDRHRAAVALPTHSRARRGPRRPPDRAPPAWHCLDSGAPTPPARGAGRRAGRRAGPPGSAGRTRARDARAPDRARSLDG